uniref:F-box domain-containing protein n=1 Tax=Globodera pallida TaxID=36090 RepID=A0A183BVG4_GLOPA
MSDNTSDEEQQQQMEEIFICADIWLEVFALLSPLELGHTMALISDRFDRLVDEHFKTRKWSLAALQTCPPGERLPIPQGPLPNNVIGFKWIRISYIDRSVIEFLQSIRRLFNSSETNVAIGTSDDQSRSWEIIWQEIWPLISDNIRHLRVCASQLDRLRQFSPTVLRSCAKLQSIDVHGLLPEAEDMPVIGLFPEFPAHDNASASSNQAVAKWLLTRRGDDLPKILYCVFNSAGMEGLKGAFVNASEPVNFIICLYFNGCISPFELKNDLTREQLAFRRKSQNWWLLVRCPIAQEAKAVVKEANALQGYRQWNCISINFKDMDIGDGMLDANDEGPSEPKK